MKTARQWLDECPPDNDMPYETGGSGLDPTEEWIFQIQADAQLEMVKSLERLGSKLVQLQKDNDYLKQQLLNPKP